jgi:hypothetical protein
MARFARITPRLRAFRTIAAHDGDGGDDPAPGRGRYVGGRPVRGARGGFHRPRGQARLGRRPRGRLALGHERRRQHRLAGRPDDRRRRADGEAARPRLPRPRRHRRGRRLPLGRGADDGDDLPDRPPDGDPRGDDDGAGDGREHRGRRRRSVGDQLRPLPVRREPLLLAAHADQHEVEQDHGQVRRRDRDRRRLRRPLDREPPGLDGEPVRSPHRTGRGQDPRPAPARGGLRRQAFVVGGLVGTRR